MPYIYKVSVIGSSTYFNCSSISSFLYFPGILFKYNTASLILIFPGYYFESIALQNYAVNYLSMLGLF